MNVFTLYTGLKKYQKTPKTGAQFSQLCDIQKNAPILEHSTASKMV